jgi:hypothetical protein
MRFAALFAFAAVVCAQPPTRVEFKCTDEDILAIGFDCTETAPCAVFLELAAANAVGPRLFITGNLHTDTATLSSILLTSEDGGSTWTEAHPRIRGAGLDQIQFFDFEVGWISGQRLQGTARDPFLLLTRDGGKSWRAVPVYEEGRTGAIEQFWFDSRNSGWLLIDRIKGAENGARHELYESMTGGESWSLMQASSTRPELKRKSPSTTPDWRVRADAASKSYRLESRQSGRWTPVAAFSIRVGECKVKEATLADAPPVEEEQAEAVAEKEAVPTPKRPAKPPTLRKKP